MFLLGCDVYAHHTVSGSSLQLQQTRYLEIANKDNEPTFANILKRREVVDIIIGTVSTCATVKDWHVSEELPLSDHQYVKCDI